MAFCHEFGRFLELHCIVASLTETEEFGCQFCQLKINFIFFIGNGTNDNDI